jgi:hypothetical protein
VPSGPPFAIISTSVGEKGVPSDCSAARVRATRLPLASAAATVQDSAARCELRTARMAFGSSTALIT